QFSLRTLRKEYPRGDESLKSDFENQLRNKLDSIQQLMSSPEKRSQTSYVRHQIRPRRRR
ncbi:hypothetical protein V3C99_012479, partial [Haemonchus contortus]